MIINIDGKRALTLISCHRDGTFSFNYRGEWVTKAKTVPRAVLEDPQLPNDERFRVMRKMNLAGVFPS
jgi:Leu/Phe-tRNA-protein transferase